jgi:hypothetical protein
MTRKKLGDIRREAQATVSIIAELLGQQAGPGRHVLRHHMVLYFYCDWLKWDGTWFVWAPAGVAVVAASFSLLALSIRFLVQGLRISSIEISLHNARDVCRRCSHHCHMNPWSCGPARAEDPQSGNQRQVRSC